MRLKHQQTHTYLCLRNLKCLFIQVIYDVKKGTSEFDKGLRTKKVDNP